MRTHGEYEHTCLLNTPPLIYISSAVGIRILPTCGQHAATQEMLVSFQDNSGTFLSVLAKSESPLQSDNLENWFPTSPVHLRH